MDRENAQFQRALDNLREVFSGTIVPVQLPIGEGGEFKGVVDLIGMKAYLGEGATASEIPAQPALPRRTMRARSSSRLRPRATTS